jgi:uncharacterized membrane protein YkvI
MAQAAFLAGLLVVPSLLLWLGHRLRDRSPAQRGAFWGGVIGHSIAILIAVSALHYPPVLWTSDVRVAIAFWVMVAGGAVGAAVGALRARRSRRTAAD